MYAENKERCKIYSFYRVLICLYIFHCSESKHHNTIVMGYEVRVLIILLYFQNKQNRINLGKSANMKRRTFLFERIIRNNKEKIWNIWKKRKLNSDKIWKVWKKNPLNSEMIWKIWKKSKLKSEMI